MHKSSLPIVSVCVCTYFRNELLRKLLLSLSKQDFPKNEFEIIVVDNDELGGAEEATRDFVQRNSDIKVNYQIEPNQGISYARNTAVALSQGEFIAFIDDDEMASSDWLSELVNTLKKYDADVVTGPVVPIYPIGTPDWIVSSKFFERPRFDTGKCIQFGDARTGNVLIKSIWLKARKPLPFKLSLACSGGEDSDFFQWMQNCDRKMVWCDSATVSEEVPFERQSLYFITERSFRTSVIYWREQYKILNFWVSLYKFMEGMLIGSVLLILSMLLIVVSKEKAVIARVKCAKLLGRVAAISDVKLIGYGKK